MSLSSDEREARETERDLASARAWANQRGATAAFAAGVGSDPGIANGAPTIESSGRPVRAIRCPGGLGGQRPSPRGRGWVRIVDVTAGNKWFAAGAGAATWPNGSGEAAAGALPWLRRGRPQPQRVEGGDGSQEPLEREPPHLLQCDQLLDGARHAGGHEDLSPFGLPAEPRRQIRHGANGAIVPASLEADGADGGVA